MEKPAGFFNLALDRYEAADLDKRFLLLMNALLRKTIGKTYQGIKALARAKGVLEEDLISNEFAQIPRICMNLNYAVVDETLADALELVERWYQWWSCLSFSTDLVPLLFVTLVDGNQSEPATASVKAFVEQGERDADALHPVWIRSKRKEAIHIVSLNTLSKVKKKDVVEWLTELENDAIPGLDTLPKNKMFEIVDSLFDSKGDPLEMIEVATFLKEEFGKLLAPGPDLMAMMFQMMQNNR